MTISKPIMASKSYPWLLVGLLWGVALLNYMDRQMLSTMRPAMELDIPELHQAENFGYLMAIFLWIYGCMSPIAGFIADRSNRKRLIVGSLLVWSAVTVGMGFARTFHELYVLRAIMGISEALYLPAGLSLIVDYHPAKTRSLAVGIHMTGIYLGQALGGFGATAAAFYSWHATFQWFGFVGIAYAAVLGLLLRNPPATQQTEGQTQQIATGQATPTPSQMPPGSLPPSTKTTPPGPGILRSLLRNPAFYIILFYFAIASLPGWAVKNWLPTLIAQNLHLDMSQAGPIATITLSIASLLGVLAGGAISDRWVSCTPRGRIYTSCIGLTLLIPALLFLGFGHGTRGAIGALGHDTGVIAGTIAAIAAAGCGLGVADANYMPILCQFVPPNARATGYGGMNSAGVFAGAIITGLLGKTSDQGHLGPGFAVLAGFVLLAVIIQYSLLKPKTNDL